MHYNPAHIPARSAACCCQRKDWGQKSGWPDSEELHLKSCTCVSLPARGGSTALSNNVGRKINYTTRFGGGVIELVCSADKNIIK